MQITILFKGRRGELRLPLAYQYIIQSAIYHWLSADPERGTWLHDQGRRYEERRFKHFTFSALQGPYRIVGREIVFPDQVELVIRSIDPDSMTVIGQDLKQRDFFTLGGQECRIEKVGVTGGVVESARLTIRMLAPVTVYRTDPDTGQTYYFTPREEDFYSRINQNFYRKYKAYYEKFPTADITLTPLKVSDRDKVVTCYKGIYINGWRGIYEISGLPAALNFLYYVGLGAKNAQGFGMFAIEKGGA